MLRDLRRCASPVLVLVWLTPFLPHRTLLQVNLGLSPVGETRNLSQKNRMKTGCSRRLQTGWFCKIAKIKIPAKRHQKSSKTTSPQTLMPSPFQDGFGVFVSLRIVRSTINNRTNLCNKRLFQIRKFCYLGNCSLISFWFWTGSRTVANPNGYLETL